MDNFNVLDSFLEKKIEINCNHISVVLSILSRLLADYSHIFFLVRFKALFLLTFFLNVHVFLFFYVITFLPPNTSKLTITRYSNTLSCNPIHIASIIRWQASAWIDLVSNSMHFFSSVILLIGWILFYVRSLFFSLLAKLLVLLLCFLSVICVSPELFQTRSFIVRVYCCARLHMCHGFFGL